jgi:ribonucleoside-diphosphate reductase alpha chain
MNTGADDWDEIPSNLEYEKSPELSSVRIVSSAGVSNTSPSVKNQRTAQAPKVDNSLDAINAVAKNMQSDAPACNVCGHIMMRSGTCYKCLNCGNQGGCS